MIIFTIKIKEEKSGTYFSVEPDRKNETDSEIQIATIIRSSLDQTAEYLDKQAKTKCTPTH